MSFHFFSLLLMTLVYIFNGYFVRAFRFYRALKNVLFASTLAPSQIYDDSTARQIAHNGRTDERTDRGTQGSRMDSF